MPQSVENAYLIILGQICLVLSGVVFGVPIVLLSDPGIVTGLDGADVFYLFFSTTVSVLLVFWIIIGWTSIRTATDNDCVYPNKMLVINIIGVVCLFAMNNVIMFGVGIGAGGAGAVTDIQKSASAINWDLAQVSAAIIYLLSSIYLYLCKMWNASYYTSYQKPRNDAYEAKLWRIIILNAGLFLVTVFYGDAAFIMWSGLIGWVACWISINKEWLRTNIIHFEPQAH